MGSQRVRHDWATKHFPWRAPGTSGKQAVGCCSTKYIWAIIGWPLTLILATAWNYGLPLVQRGWSGGTSQVHQMADRPRELSDWGLLHKLGSCSKLRAHQIPPFCTTPVMVATPQCISLVETMDQPKGTRRGQTHWRILHFNKGEDFVCGGGGWGLFEAPRISD